MAVESAPEMAKRLMDDIGDATQGSYTKGEVRTILNAIAMKQDTTAENTVPVDRLSRGDVFIGKSIGGKQRPWIVLSSRAGRVCAVALSTSAPLSGVKVADRSKCRLWPGSWITAALTVFNEEEARQHVSRPYTNKAHLRVVEEVLAGIFRLPRVQKPRRRQTPKLRAVS